MISCPLFSEMRHNPFISTSGARLSAVGGTAAANACRLSVGLGALLGGRGLSRGSLMELTIANLPPTCRRRCPDGPKEVPPTPSLRFASKICGVSPIQYSIAAVSVEYGLAYSASSR